VEFVAESNPRVVLMTGGKIMADGTAKTILTDEALVTKASIVPPQITQIFLRLTDLGLPTDIIDVYQARDVLHKYLEERRR
jgi:hypothetical protein